MFDVTVPQIYQWIGQYFWPFCRISAFFTIMPILSTQLVPMRIRLGLALAVTLVVAPLVDPVPMVELLSLHSFLIIAQQIMVGLAMGFVLQLLFQIFVVGGQMVAMQNGLGFATLVDPVNGVNVASISQIYLMTVNLLFFALNGHLAVMYLLGSSFEHMPVSTVGLPAQNLLELVRLASWMFTGAVLVALPSIIALLVVNLSFGVISRAAPQMNIIAIGFPFTMVLGLVIIWLGLGNVLPQYEKLSGDAFDYLQEMVR
ncbi:flagellar type III secretion system protein FliR [Ketobacter sp. MCCC 1A13808]|uniref:flagellar biosynthetic protein FliR n=1 Tax=Ketobacter sp. MCCC 1A13808 TaxID=2602738 RepID=UPI000F1D4A0C|nr:flagellar biosynthetic protein FliR [Ketobacter sp. MCCC 1A13808]MVF10904.1 flagellar type III secretion system protein FliR [Ketobacter sp. MCCC 1A13808]RLP56296.1 MAG: flagellar type III secretion system protein FliR [Ketobacter sp.]